MLQYTRNVLSTRAMAAYVMETMRTYSKGHIPNTNIKLILYLTHQDHDMDKGSDTMHHSKYPYENSFSYIRSIYIHTYIQLSI